MRSTDTASFTTGMRCARVVDLRIERNDDPLLVLRMDPPRAFTPAPGEMERRFGMDPEGHFVARVDGEPAGVASTATWPAEAGGLAWIYSMVVAEAHRRKGIARALLRHALAHVAARGARVVALDATQVGRPLYASEGFEAVAQVPRWRRKPGTQPRAPEGPRTVSIYPISSCEVMDLWRYDAPRFGASRMPWLASAMARFPERTFVAFDRASGDIVGYVESQERWIGPLVADSAEAAAWLLFAAERAGAPPVAIVGPDHAGAAALLARVGFEPEGMTCTRMTRGGPLPGRLETQWLTSGWALG